MRPAVGRALRAARAEHDGGEQHLAARHALHGDGGPAGPRLHDGRLDPRPRRYDPRAGRSRDQAFRPGAPGTHQPPARPAEGRAAPPGPHRSGRGPGQASRVAARRRADRDHERGRHDGPPPAVTGDRPKVRPEDHLDRLADRLPAARGVDRRTGRDGSPAYGVGRLPHHAVPPEVERRGTRRAHQRRMERRGAGAHPRAFVVRHGRHFRTAATAASSSTARCR